MGEQGGTVRIEEVASTDSATIEQMAALLVEAFGHLPSGYTTMEAGRAEVAGFFEAGHIVRVARDAGGLVLGWIGGIESYGGNVWELHPLVVRRGHQRAGLGRRLVAALEAEVAARGAMTLLLGTDDEAGQTTLGGAELYPEPLHHLRGMRNLADHPYSFYEKLGFVRVGVIPDANGFGKPDILMAKRVAVREGLGG